MYGADFLKMAKDVSQERGSFESDLRTGFYPAASLNRHLLLDMITFLPAHQLIS
jgi:hypothetical protein